MSLTLRFSTARQVFEAYPQARGDIESIPSDEDPRLFVKSAASSATPEDAISFCAYLLPQREAVWWGCQCVRQIESPLAEEDDRLVATAEAWVKHPAEDMRLAALEAASAASRQSTALWMALAAAWSGGEFAIPGAPPTPVPPYLTAKAVRAAVLTALARVDRRERQNYIRASVIAALKLVNTDAATR